MLTPFTDAAGNFNDAVALNFVQSNLTNVQPTVYRRKYQNADYARHLPVVTQGNAWAASTTWYAMDATGEAKFITGQATDIPYVGLTKDQFTSPYYMVASGFTWNIEEVNQAAIAGVNIGAELPIQARGVVERKLYDIAIQGGGEKGLTGLINDPDVTRYTVAADGTGSATTFASKTPDQIIRDINTLLTGIITATASIEYADTLRLPVAAFNYVASTRLGNGDGALTVLKFIAENNVYTASTGQPLDIAPIVELATAGQSGVGRMVAYRNAEEVLRFDLVMPFMILPVRSRSIMSYESAGLARTGGTQVRLPGAMRYADGVS